MVFYKTEPKSNYNFFLFKRSKNVALCSPPLQSILSDKFHTTDCSHNLKIPAEASQASSLSNGLFSFSSPFLFLPLQTLFLHFFSKTLRLPSLSHPQILSKTSWFLHRLLRRHRASSYLQHRPQEVRASDRPASQ